MAPESMRLFIALELPSPALDALTSLQKRLQANDTSRAVRWSAVQGIHLTLKFLGEVSANRQEEIITALSAAVDGHRVFELSIQGAGCFPDYSRPRVIWAGCGGEIAVLQALHDAVERAISPLGFPTDDRAFSPHLTLGRAHDDASRPALAALGQSVKAIEAASLAHWQVEGVSLMRSDLKPSGAVYTQVVYRPLAPRET
ncbi:MAG TPA: RNA 2',3'-cyclic phosphodiesterase [Aggregatilineales bacterium]|nr:RNA 2',3'-cyclic phosphodiesterase [Aggregatilineales bacterium]